MSRFKVGEPVQFVSVRMHKGIFVTPANPKQVKSVKEEAGKEAVYEVQFLDAEGNPHVIPGVKESELAGK
jgi:hypothetical protein